MREARKEALLSTETTVGHNTYAEVSFAKAAQEEVRAIISYAEASLSIKRAQKEQSPTLGWAMRWSLKQTLHFQAKL